MRFGFVTCVQLGLSCMEEIYAAGGSLELAITLNDEKARTKSGRVYLDRFCSDHSIGLVKIDTINSPAAIQAIKANAIDWLFIIGWSQVAGAEVLAAPSRGVLGIHPTLLPEGRGRAPIPWAIIKGLDRTGVTLFKLDSGVDTGPIVEQYVVDIGPDETATTLYQRVDQAHRDVIRKVWPKLVSDTIELRPQDEGKATVWPGRTPEDGRILESMTVAEADRLVRAVARPYPGAFIDRNGKRYRIWQGERVDSDRGRPLVIELADGYFAATVWDEEGIT